MFWASLVLFILYPLSTGPVCRLYYEILEPMDSNHAVESALETFYMPLILLAEASDPVQDFFIWYLYDVWGVLISPPNY